MALDAYPTYGSGERNNTTKAICEPHCRMAAAPYPAYGLFAPILFRQLRYRALIVDQMAHRQYRMSPQHAWPRPAHHLLHLFTFCGLITVHRALLAGRFRLAEDALIKPLLRVGVEIRVVRRAAHRIRAGALIEGNHLPDSQFFPQDAWSRHGYHQ